MYVQTINQTSTHKHTQNAHIRTNKRIHKQDNRTHKQTRKLVVAVSVQLIARARFMPLLALSHVPAHISPALSHPGSQPSDAMTDPFALALASPCDDEVEIVDVSNGVGSSSRSRGVHPEQDPCAIAENGAGSACTNSQKRKASRNAISQPIKRKKSFDSAPKHTIAEQKSPIRCVYVPDIRGGSHTFRANKIAAIPLWPQYTLSWRSETFADPSWIVVGNYERWIMQLVDVAPKDAVRGVAARALDIFRAQFRTCLDRARTPVSLKNPLAPDADNNEDGETVVRAGTRRELVVQVDFQGHVLTCLNTLVSGKGKVFLMLDDYAERFVVDFFVPLVIQTATTTARTTMPTSATKPPKADDQKKGACFQIGVDSTPSIRDKVTWVPAEHRWNVTIKKEKGPFQDRLAECIVDKSLEGESYEQAKLRAYSRAVAVWNEFDGTKRDRIIA